MKIHLHIDQLDLYGLALEPRDTEKLGRALREQLTTLLIERGIHGSSIGRRAASSMRVEGASIDIGSARDAAAVGASIAASLDASLCRLPPSSERTI